MAAGGSSRPVRKGRRGMLWGALTPMPLKD